MEDGVVAVLWGASISAVKWGTSGDGSLYGIKNHVTRGRSPSPHHSPGAALSASGVFQSSHPHTSPVREGPLAHPVALPKSLDHPRLTSEMLSDSRKAM